MHPVTAALLHLRMQGLSQSEIGRRTGITQSKLSRWQRGLLPHAVVESEKLIALLKEVKTAAESTTRPTPEKEAA